MRATNRRSKPKPTRCEMEALLIVIGIIVSFGPTGGGKAGW
jgi:hypothetical protein